METNHPTFGNASRGRPYVRVCAIFVFAVAGLAPGGDAQTPETDREMAVTRLSAGDRSAIPKTVDAGDFYRIEGRKMRLLKSLEKVAVQHASSQGPALRKRLMTRQWPQRLWTVNQALTEEQTLIVETAGLSSLAELDEIVGVIQKISDVVQVTPVYINEASGLEMICTNEFIVKLAPNVSLEALEVLNGRMGVTLVRRLRGTTDQFILGMDGFSPEGLLAMCEIYLNDRHIVWASPNFLSQVGLHSWPVDRTYSPEQWHLEKIEAAGAWDITTGSPDIVVAVMDNGVDIDHIDLRSNFPDGESDTSDNGYANDTYGWDFYDNDNDPRPSNAFDNHGTSVAGVIAANKGSRDEGALGCAYHCTLMALKVAKGDPQDAASWASDAQMAEAILYAAGFNEDGIGRWHGADVINVSLTLVPKWEINEALAKAATQGRLGKGCPIFCASGNDTAGWTSLSVSGFQSGSTYTCRWQYAKKPSGSLSTGAVWLDTVIFPGGDIERFEGGIPSGWKTTGNSNWISVRNGLDGNHAMTGWDGENSRAVRTGSIGINEFCLLEITRSFKEGSFQFWYWPAMESGEQLDFVIVQGNTEVYRQSLNSEKRTQDYIPYISVVSYPALHPDTIGVGASTNFDYRADYSRYGFGLDFVAPSGGGSESIYTTDRRDTSVQVGAEGNYTDFSGTSAASPLAAAVGALMLSANPDLTAQQVRDIMQATCEQIGNEPYSAGDQTHPNTNQFFGHGRINASLAVNAAKEMTQPDGSAGM